MEPESVESRQYEKGPNRPASSDQILTVKEVSAQLKVSSEQVRTLIRQGQLSAVNVGSGKKRPLYRITHEALESFMKLGQQPNPSIFRKRSRRLPPAPDFFTDLR
jgi:excisionase family DNA binding protein